MKEQEQSQQERERQIMGLRKRVNSLSMPELCFYLTISGVGSVLAIESQINGTPGIRATIFQIVVALWFLLLTFNLLSRIGGLKIDEETMQMGAGELALKFKKMKKFCAKVFAFFSAGILCQGVSILIGVFELSQTLLVGCCVALAVSVYDYWKYQKSEKIARRLAEQSND
ncbi:MAG: hypothetical protein ISN29_08800 [Gammaproteobacteria bacterium AqS3]|nr:hypothetical protein [Gammaproteobacteria bacterium AqS3]